MTLSFFSLVVSGPPVQVDVTMFIISISSVSEVQMVSSIQLNSFWLPLR